MSYVVKRRIKRKFVYAFYLVVAFVILMLLNSFYDNYKFKVIESTYEDGNAIISYKTNSKEIYCLLSMDSEKPEISDGNWIKGEDNKCILPVEMNNSYSLFVKNNRKIISNNKYNASLNFELDNNESEIYLIEGEMATISYQFLDIGKVSTIYKDYDENIISIDENNVFAKKNGETNITLKYGKFSKNVNVIVTNLLTKAPLSFDFDKKFLECNHYTNEENELLDKVLKYKIDLAGYKTRAGVLAAARFLTLEFPYRVDYFYENGRLAFVKNKVDGEGRYYHEGLYLSESKIKDIEYSLNGPLSWGCSMYSTSAYRKMSNGLDCSGFVTWAILNGGFNPGDIGAGITNVTDLTDIGQRKTLSSSLINTNEIKAGDLLWNDASGGHIAIIVGIDTKNYYVGEALWDDYPEKGVIVNTYSKKELVNNYRYVILMDDYYENDGNYTSMW